MKGKNITSGWPLTLYVAATLLLAAGSAAAILLNPWFSFLRNAMSDLGNPGNGPFYWVFNYTLIAGGALFAAYFALVFSKVRPRTSLLMAVTSLFLVLVGVFHEGVGRIHFYVSVLYFVNGMAGLAAYWGERRSLYGLAGLYTSMGLFGLYYAGLLGTGVSVPEVVSTAFFYFMPLVEFMRRRR